MSIPLRPLALFPLILGLWFAGPALSADRIEALWERRGDIATAKEAVAACESAVRERPMDFGLLERTSRLHYWIGLNLEATDEGEAQNHFAKGKAFAERAVEVDPGRAGGYFLKAANLAEWVLRKGKPKALAHGSEIRSLAEKAESLERGYFFSGPDRLLCDYYARMPGILGGDLGKAIERGRRAVTAHPEYAGNRVSLAGAYFKDGKNDLARKELEEALGTPDNAVSGGAPEQRMEKGRAAALLPRIGR